MTTEREQLRQWRERFYRWLERLVEAQYGYRYLADADGGMGLPRRGVYFFWEPDCSRVVRVGTHALKADAKSTLWGRLSQHRGSRRSGGGNHRGSIFRLLVGDALMGRGDHECVESWGVKSDPGSAARALGMDRAVLEERELPLERLVSEYIGKLPFAVVGIDDAPGPDSKRGYLKRNSIALLSAYHDAPPPSYPQWLGNHSGRAAVRNSLLWHNHHVEEKPDPDFIPWLEQLPI